MFIDKNKPKNITKARGVIQLAVDLPTKYQTLVSTPGLHILCMRNQVCS